VQGVGKGSTGQTASHSPAESRAGTLAVVVETKKKLILFDMTFYYTFYLNYDNNTHRLNKTVGL
jgi:hypothetical protein